MKQENNVVKDGMNQIADGTRGVAEEIVRDAAYAAKNEVKYNVRRAVRKGVNEIMRNIFK